MRMPTMLYTNSVHVVLDTNPLFPKLHPSRDYSSPIPQYYGLRVRQTLGKLVLSSRGVT